MPSAPRYEQNRPAPVIDYSDYPAAEHPAWKLVYELEDRRKNGGSNPDAIQPYMQELNEILDENAQRPDDQKNLSDECLTELLFANAVHNPHDPDKVRPFVEQLKNPLYIYRYGPEAIAIGRHESQNLSKGQAQKVLSPLHSEMRLVMIGVLKTGVFRSDESADLIKRTAERAAFYDAPLTNEEMNGLQAMNQQAQNTRLINHLPAAVQTRYEQFNTTTRQLVFTAVGFIDSVLSFNENCHGRVGLTAIGRKLSQQPEFIATLKQSAREP